MTELELYEICEKSKRVRIHLTEGETVEGKVYGFTQAVDNDPEIPEIDIRLDDGSLSGAMLDEIESIEVLE